MLKFFTKHKKVRGAITMFLTIIYMATYFMTGALVDGGRIKMAHANIESAQQIATENIMSQYHKGLYELYGLFGTNGYSEENLKSSIKSQMEEILNLKIPDSVIESLSKSGSGDLASEIKNRFDPYGINVEDINVAGLPLTAENVDLVRAQMRDEVKYDSLQHLVNEAMPYVQKVIEILGTISTIKVYFELITKKSPVADLVKEFEKYEKEFTNNYRTIIQTFYSNKDQPDDEGVGYITYSSRGFLQDTLDKFIEGKSVEDMSEGEAEQTLDKFEGEVNKELEESEKVTPDEGKRKVEDYKRIRMDDRKTEFSAKFDSSDIATWVYENPDDEYAFLYNNEEYTGTIAAQNKFRDEESRKWPNPNDDKYKDKEEDSDNDDDDDDTSEDSSQNDGDSNSDEQSDGKSGEERYIEDVIACADNRKIEFDKKIEKLEGYIVSAIENLEGACIKEEEYLDKCNTEVLPVLVKRTEEDDDGNKMDEMIDKHSISILAGQIESNLITWEKTAERIEKLKSAKDKFKEAKEALDLVKAEVELITDKIKEEAGNEGLTWRYNESYKIGNRQCVADLQRNIRETADIIMRPRAETFDAFAYITRFLLAFKKVLDDAQDKLKASDGKLFTARWDDLYERTFDDGRPQGAPFTYTIDSHIEEDELSTWLDMLKFVFKAIIDPVGAVTDLIDDISQEIIDTIKAFGDINNYYEAAYIMTNCRDFVHTYWRNEHIKDSAGRGDGKKSKPWWLKWGERIAAVGAIGGAVAFGLTAAPLALIAGVAVAAITYASGALEKFTSPDVKDFIDTAVDSAKQTFAKIHEKYDEFCEKFCLTSIQYDDDANLDAIMNEKFVSKDLGNELLAKNDFKDWKVTPLEIEYILSKRKSTEQNNKKIMQDMYNRILRLRVLINYISAWASAACAKDMTTVITSSGPAAIIVAPLIPLLYALPESYVEAEYIMRCKKANFFNGVSNIRLWTGFTDFATIALTIDKKASNGEKDANKKKIEGYSKEIEETVKNMYSYEKLSTDEFLKLIEETAGGAYSGIQSGVDKLRYLKDKKIYDTAEVETKDKDIVLKGVEFVTDAVEEGIEEGNKEALKIAKKSAESVAGPLGYQPRGYQAGYTFYLFLFLVMGGARKDEQIKRFLDVVETNMKRGFDEGFKLENTYAQISVETNTSMKYIFMTQSFIKQLLEKKAINIGDRFSMTTKTAFGY